jgi:amino acid transporter
MVSFFGLSLSCLNAGSRIIDPMSKHGIFSGHLGKTHVTNRTPHVAITVFIALIFIVPSFMMIFTNRSRCSGTPAHWPPSGSWWRTT